MYKLCVHFDINGLGYILGDFFANSFGRPGAHTYVIFDKFFPSA
jgi:hypothetical protein